MWGALSREDGLSTEPPLPRAVGSALRKSGLLIRAHRAERSLDEPHFLPLEICS